MNIKYLPLLSLFVLLAVLFALSSCSEAGTESPSSALSNHKLTYAPIRTEVNKEIAAVSPVWNPQLDSANVTYTSAYLPAGLTLDAQTGIISGRPTDIIEARDYIITAEAKELGVYTGEVSASVSIMVLRSLNLGDFGFSYYPAYISTTVGSTVNISPQWTTALELPDEVSYSIENADTTPADLPTGLRFEGATGVISGKPEEEAPKRTYIITVAPKEGAVYTGEASFPISITVLTADNISGYTLSYPNPADEMQNKIEGVVGSPLSVTPSWEPVLTTPGDVTYSIAPSLDEATTGLRFDTTAGSISGTPTNVTATGEYRITATAKNPGSYSGEKTVSVSITIFAANDIAGPDYSLSYPDTTTPVGTEDVTIAATWKPVQPGTVTYSASPKLPAGLEFTTNGDITGTPTAAKDATTYTVTASATGSHSGTLTTKEFTITITSIALDDKGRSFSYGDISIEVNKQIEGTGFLPTWEPVLDYPDAVSYRIEPSLATKTPGLSFNTETGAITGTPTAAKAATTYTVTATGSGNHSGTLTTKEFTITISRIELAKDGRSFSYGDISIEVNKQIEGDGFLPQWTQELDYPDAVSYRIEPSLATATTGLSFNTDTGAIRGTPTAALPLTTYTVTATGTGNQTGELSAEFTIILRMDISAAPPTLSYQPITAEVGKELTDVHPTWKPTLDVPTQVSYEITKGTDLLPAGLELVTTTGVIRGTPTGAVAAAKDYRITVTGSEPYTGTREVTVNITITMDINTLTLSYPSIATEANKEIPDVYPVWPPELESPPQVSYKITENTPSLPTGLELVTTTGVIRGTPTVLTPKQDYRITVTGLGLYTGTREVTVNITVAIDMSAHTFTYPLATGPLSAISAVPVWADSTPEDLTVTYRVESTQNLPTGLNLDTNTGGITGSFTSLAHVTVYKVIASGTGTYMGNTEAVFLDTLALGAEYTPIAAESSAISTRKQLENMTADGTYHLINHIDLGPEPAADPGSTNHYWTPIPTFTGILDGNGYAIYNLNIAGDTADYQGLFATIGSSASVKNLGIGVGTITAGAAIGGLAGYAIGSTIDNITIAGMSDTATIRASDTVTIDFIEASYVGGLVGYLAAGSTLTGNSIGLSVSSANSHVGGLVGYNSGTITGYATGSVDSTGEKAGGIVGDNQGSTTGYATGDVTGASWVGGLVGYNNNLGGTVTGYATGSVTGTVDGYVGGLVGGNNGTASGYATGTVSATDDDDDHTEGVGGLMGWNNGTASGYATGDVSGIVVVGGLIGINYGTARGYATGAVTGTDNVGGLAGSNTGSRAKITGYATGAVSGDTWVGGLVGQNGSGTSATGYATGAVSSGRANTAIGGLVGYNDAGTITGYWDQESTGQDARGFGATITGGGISATKNIAYTAGPPSTYTDSGRQDSPAIFNADGFGDAFDLTGTDEASKTWPKLSASMTFNYTAASAEKVFTLVQPTVSDKNGTGGAGDGTIEVDMPEQEKFPEGWPLN